VRPTGGFFVWEVVLDCINVSYNLSYIKSSMNGVNMWRYLRKHSLVSRAHRLRLGEHDVFVGEDGFVVSPVSQELGELLHKHSAFQWEGPLNILDVVELAQDKSQEIQALTAAILEAYAWAAEQPSQEDSMQEQPSEVQEASMKEDSMQEDSMQEQPSEVQPKRRGGRPRKAE